ncbi:MAG: FtsX-like permease family protein [Micrococcales bacterium]|nr:FtsX-like permease family protein [Micrococcales bacterium]
MSATVVPPVLPLAALVTRGRAAAGQAWTDLLTVAAIAVSTTLLLSVVAGTRVFHERQQHPPQPFLTQVGPEVGERASAVMGQWTFLALGACVLLVVPVLTLSAAAARMGALGRARRLAALRLLGMTASQSSALATLETLVAAAAGVVVGTAGYYVLAPVWSLVTFQATALDPGQMLAPPSWVAGTVAVVLVLTAVAAWAGLRDVRISPLGVARQAPRRGLRWRRALAVPVSVVAWVLIAPGLHMGRGLVVVYAVVLGVLAAFMAVVNLVGPLVLQGAGHVLVRCPAAAQVLAGRRLLADPRAAWRNVSGLAFVGFAGGTLLALPLTAAASSPVDAVLVADIRTGTVLTMVIAFVVAAASTTLNQAASVLDRQAVLVHLDHAGTPRALMHQARRTEVLVPTLVAAVGSAGLSAMFFTVLGARAGLAGNPGGSVALAGVLAVGTALVVAASESCRGLVRTVLAGPRAR